MSAFGIAAGVFAISVGIANVFIELIGGVGWSIVLVVCGIGAIVANYRVLRLMGVRYSWDHPSVSAFAAALLIGCLSFGLSYLIGGREVGIASLVVAPILLMPIAVQIARRLREPDSEQELPSSGDRRRKLILASLVFAVASGLGAIGLDIPGHSDAEWLYLATVAIGALWAVLAAIVVSR